MTRHVFGVRMGLPPGGLAPTSVPVAIARFKLPARCRETPRRGRRVQSLARKASCDGERDRRPSFPQNVSRTPARGRIPRTSLPTNSSYCSSVRLSTATNASNFSDTCHTADASSRVYEEMRTSPVAIDESSELPTYVADAEKRSVDSGEKCAPTPPRHSGRLRSELPVDATSLVACVTLPSICHCSFALKRPASS